MLTSFRGFQNVTLFLNDTIFSLWKHLFAQYVTRNSACEINSSSSFSFFFLCVAFAVRRQLQTLNSHVTANARLTSKVEMRRFLLKLVTTFHKIC